MVTVDGGRWTVVSWTTDRHLPLHQPHVLFSILQSSTSTPVSPLQAARITGIRARVSSLPSFLGTLQTKHIQPLTESLRPILMTTGTELLLRSSRHDGVRTAQTPYRQFMSGF
jgi:hypothetical protein